MSKTILAALLAAALSPLPALAVEKPLDKEDVAVLGASFCDLSRYKGDSQAFDPAFVIPDNQPVATLVGTLATAFDGTEFQAVALELGIAHTWMGDLVVRLEYVDCNDGTLIHGADILCRPRGTNVLLPAPCGGGSSAGCSGNLGSAATTTPPPDPVSYYFSDSSTTALASGACPGVAPTGCYLPTIPGALAGFHGLDKGGCWKLYVADWADRDVGAISHWAIYMDNVPIVSTRMASWGRLKTIYR